MGAPCTAEPCSAKSKAEHCAELSEGQSKEVGCSSWRRAAGSTSGGNDLKLLFMGFAPGGPASSAHAKLPNRKIVYTRQSNNCLTACASMIEAKQLFLSECDKSYSILHEPGKELAHTQLLCSSCTHSRFSMRELLPCQRESNSRTLPRIKLAPVQCPDGSSCVRLASPPPGDGQTWEHRNYL